MPVVRHIYPIYPRLSNYLLRTIIHFRYNTDHDVRAQHELRLLRPPGGRGDDAGAALPRHHIRVQREREG